MGYDSRIYIVEKRQGGVDHYGDGKIYSRVIAMFDVCKFNPLSDALRNKSKTNCYFFADDGDTRITEDRYGEPLNEASVAETIAILEKIVEKGENYRRIFPLLATLNTIDEQLKNGIWQDVVVLHYGY